MYDIRHLKYEVTMNLGIWSWQWHAELLQLKQYNQEQGVDNETKENNILGHMESLQFTAMKFCQQKFM